MNEFYNQIEEPIRDLVKVLRDNGINTVCSCGHKMYIEADIIPDGALQIIHNVLYNYFSEHSKPINYKIEVTVECIEGDWKCFSNIKFPIAERSDVK